MANNVNKVYILLEVCMENDVPDIADLIASSAYMIQGVDQTMQGGVRVVWSSKERVTEPSRD